MAYGYSALQRRRYDETVDNVDTVLAVTAGAVVQGGEASFQGLGFLPGFEDGGRREVFLRMDRP